MVKPEELKDLLHMAHLERRDAIILILASKENQPVKTTEIVKTGQENGIAKISSWNVSQYLGGGNGIFVKLPAGWVLGPKGRQSADALVAKLSGGPLVIVNQTLRGLVPKLPSTDAQSFVSEAITCYEAKCYRAAVVLSWVGAVSILHGHVIKKHLGAFNSEASTRIPNWKPAKTGDDLGLMKEDLFLEILATISVIGKNVKENLKTQCLALRNACGHPNSFVIGESTTAAHLESLINNVFTKF